MGSADGMQRQFGQAYQQPASIASPVKYLNRAPVLDRPLLANPEPPSITATVALPVNSAVELFGAAYRDPGPAANSLRWAKELTAVGDPGPMAILANTVFPSMTTPTGVPVNDAGGHANRG